MPAGPRRSTVPTERPAPPEGPGPAGPVPPVAASAVGLRFRAARYDDVDAIVGLVDSAYRGESSRAGWTTEADLLDGQRTDAREVSALLARPGSLILLAEAASDGAAPDGAAHDGAVEPGVDLVGCCHLERRGADTAYFGMFAVAPRRQAGGLGRSLLGAARDRAAEWGCREMRMTVIRQREDLIAWYARHGFEPTGETEPFPYGDERFGRPRRPDLEFVVLAGPVRHCGAGPG